MIEIVDASMVADNRKKKTEQVEVIMEKLQDYQSKIKTRVLNRKNQENIFTSFDFLNKDFDNLDVETLESMHDEALKGIKMAVGEKYDTDLSIQNNIDNIKTFNFDFNFGRLINQEIENCHEEEKIEFSIQTSIKKKKKESEITEKKMVEETEKGKFETRIDKAKKSIGKTLQEMRQESKELFDNSSEKRRCNGYPI